MGNKIRNNNFNKLVKASILTAIAFILMYFDFYIGFPIMKFDFSDVTALVGAFALGPVWGVVIELVKNLLIILFKGTNSGYVGEFANFIVGAAYVFPAALVYKYRKSRSGALVSMCIGTLSMIVFVVLANYYILLPFYMNVMHIPLEGILKMVNNPLIDSKFTYIIYLVIPFNFIKAAIISVITFLLYKRISPILHK